MYFAQGLIFPLKRIIHYNETQLLGMVEATIEDPVPA